MSRATARYVEAYPRIRLREAYRQLHAGYVGQFFDELGKQRGEIFLAEPGEASFTCGYAIKIKGRLIDGELTLPRPKPAGTAEAPGVVPCLKCERSAAVIVFNGVWGCRICLNLRYRSQLISKQVAQSERLRALDDLIGRGRPRYMRHKAHRELAGEQAKLGAELGELRHSVGAAHNQAMTLQWTHSSEVERIAHPDFCLVSGEVRRGEGSECATKVGGARPLPGPVDGIVVAEAALDEVIGDDDIDPANRADWIEDRSWWGRC